MIFESVYSDSGKYFVSNPNPKKGECVDFLLRVSKDEQPDHVFLRARQLGVEELYEMEICTQLDGLLYYKTSVKIRDNRFNYHFYLVKDSQIFYYTQFKITDTIPTEAEDFVLLCDYEAPSWVKDTVFYQIFPDRFYNGKPELNVKAGEYSYQGFETCPEENWDAPEKTWEEGHALNFHNGDLYGIIEKLDYLQELGINGIYLNPIFISPSVHKYDALDYFHIDPHLGGDESFAKLIEEMHKRGIKLLLDISINHTSNSANWFKDPACREFYFFNDDDSYECWFGVKTMPQLNYTSEKLRDIIYRAKDSVLKKWLLPPYGIDGWRFDVADCMARNEKADVHDEVLSEIRTELKGVNKDVFLVAEEWADCSCDLQGNRWDSTMNYFGCARPLREFAGAKDLYHERNSVLKATDTRLTASQLSKRLTQFYARLPGVIHNQLFNLLDSHDVVRLHNTPGINFNDCLSSVIMSFTLPGTTCIYYGDEIKLDGNPTFTEGCRYPFNWNWQENPSSVETRNFYKTLIQLRRSREELKDGGFKIIFAKDFVISYARFTRDSASFIISSVSDSEEKVFIPLNHYGISTETELHEAFNHKFEKQVIQSGIEIKIPPHTSFVLHT